MRTRSKVALTSVVAASLVVGGVGTAYAARYQDRALPGSSVSGAAVSGLTRDEAAAAIRDRADDVVITIDSGDTSRTAHLSELGYTVDVDATLDAVFARNDSLTSYAKALVTPLDVPAVVHVDDDLVDQVVVDLIGAAGEAGANAKIKLAKSGKSFEVVPAVNGRSVVSTSFQDVVESAARTMTSATATVEFSDTPPAITTEKAKAVADAANALVKRSVVITDDSGKHTASEKTKASWVSIAQGDGSLGEPTVDAKKVTSWVEGVATDVTREPRSGVRNVTESGKVLQVVTEARDGAKPKNASSVAERIAASLAEGKDYSGSFEMATVEAKYQDRVIADGVQNLAYQAAPGEKWIDINLSKFTMTAYVGGKAVKGPISMVSGASETPTVTGTYKVYYKNPLMDMKGTNADGTPYETKDVPWATFFYRGYGLHGAPWRSSFGYTGSHGCINLPVDVSKWVYDFADIGTTVVSHY